MAKRRTKKADIVAAPTAVQVIIEPSDDTPTYYINHAEIAHNVHDFTVSAVRVPAKFTAAQRSGIQSDKRLVLDSLLHVVMPASLVPGMIRALQRQRELYEKQFGIMKDEEQNAPNSGKNVGR